MIRRTARLVSAVVLAGLVGLSTGCDRGVSVATTGDEYEANRIVVELVSQGLHGVEKRATGDRRNPGWAIVAPAEFAEDARLTLVALGLPRPVRPGLAEAVEAGGLMPSAVDDRMRLMHALAGELERTYLTYDGVVEARVHLAIPEARGLGLLDRPAPAVEGVTASVLLKHVALEGGASGGVAGGASGGVPDADTVARLAAQAVEGLEAGDVVVSMTPSSLGLVELPAVQGDGASSLASKQQALEVLFVVLVVFAAAVLVLAWKLFRRVGQGGEVHAVRGTADLAGKAVSA